MEGNWIGTIQQEHELCGIGGFQQKRGNHKENRGGNENVG
jgi:hypothetical protein